MTKEQLLAMAEAVRKACLDAQPGTLAMLDVAQLVNDYQASILPALTTQLGDEPVEMTEHLAKWGQSMVHAAKHYRVCVHCGGFEAMVGMKWRLYHAQQALMARLAAPAPADALA